jgi:MFS family permease
MISVPSFRRDFGYSSDGQYILPAKWQAAFNNVSSIGQFFGGFICSQVADKIGRKKAIALGVMICTGGIIGQIVTTTKGGFLGAKLVLGFGLGFYLTLGPLCCSEVRSTTTQKRSSYLPFCRSPQLFFVALQQLALILG